MPPRTMALGTIASLGQMPPEDISHPNICHLGHCGPTTSDLWAILERSDNSQATSNKMMWPIK